MRRSWKMALGAVTLALAVAGCGGGGSDVSGQGNSPGTSNEPGPGQVKAVELRFTPPKVVVNQQFGSSTTFVVQAEVADASAIDGELHVQVVDVDKALSGAALQIQRSATGMTVTAQTNGGLALGKHQGKFEVRLCRDAGCTKAYAGSPFTLEYDIHVSAQALAAKPRTVTTASIYAGGSVATSVVVDVTGLPAAWSARTSVGWLTLAGANGSGDGSFEVRYQAAGLAAGTHQGLVTITSSDGQNVDLPFTLSVLPSQFTVSGGTLTFTAVNGARISPQALEFQLVGAPDARWTVTSPVPWLTVSPQSGTAPEPVELRIRPEVGPLSSGTYTAQLGLRAPGMVEDKLVPVQLNLLRPTLSLNSPAITLGGAMGRDFAPAQVPISLNTGVDTHPFVVEALPAWMDGSTRSGRVGQAGSQLSLVTTSDAAAGTRTATPTLKATVNGDVIAVPLTVTANRDQRRLLASQWGVGFSSTPRGSVLNRTLTIRHNFGDAVAWTATSDKPWLTVSASGTTAGASTLTLAADPSSLALPSLEVATVVVQPSSAGTNVLPAIVRVGLWRDASGLPALVQQAAPYVGMVTDPIRPYVYAHDGSNIDVFNIYTAQKVGSIAAAGTGLRLMAVSRDGMTLYAADIPSSSVGVFDLATLSRKETIPLVEPTAQSSSMSVGRVNGNDILFFSNGRAVKGPRQFVDFPQWEWSGEMIVSASGTRLYVFSGGATRAFDIDYSEAGGGTLTEVPNSRVANEAYLSGNGIVPVLSADDRTLFLTGPIGIYPVDTGSFGSPSGPYGYEYFNPDPPLFTNNAFLNGIATTHDGRVVAAYGGEGTDESKIYVYTPARTVKSTQYVNGGVTQHGQFGVTPDGLVAVSLSESSYTGKKINFVPLVP